MNFFKKNKKTITRILFTVFVVSFVVLPITPAIPVHATPEQVFESAGQNDVPVTLPDEESVGFGCIGSTEMNSSRFAGCTAMVSYYLFMYPAAKMAGWLSILFNIAFLKLVVGMGSAVDTMTGITIAWQTIRDITNVFLVFLLVYVGIATILGISSFGYKRLLWKILLAALLVNFSITFTKVIIDVTNITAISMYGEIMGEVDGHALAGCLDGPGIDLNATLQLDSNDCARNGIAGVFWSKLKLTSSLSPANLINNANANKGGADKQWALMWASIFGGIMFWTLAFVFGAAAFFLIGRFVTLIFLMVMSPIALMAWITGVSNSGSKWWHTLLNQSVFAPLILLMWYITLQVLSGLEGQLLGTGSGSEPSDVAMIMTFIIATGFLVGSLMLAKKFGAYGASAVMNTGKQWAGVAAGAMTVGAAAYVGRQTVGRGASALTNNENLKNTASSDNKNFATRHLARMSLAASKRTADSSFDGRSLTKSKALGKAGGKGGFNKWAEGKAKTEEARNKHLATYTGTSEEKDAHDRELNAVDTHHKPQVEDAKRRYDDTIREAKQKRDTAIEASKTLPMREMMETRKYAKQRYAKEIEDARKAREDLNQRIVAKKNEVNQKYADAYKAKGEERSKSHVEALSRERTFEVFKTPEWKRKAAEEMRKKGGKTKVDKAKDALWEEAVKKAKEEETSTPDSTEESTPEQPSPENTSE